MIISLPISSIKSYINRTLIFVSKTKLGINPLFACVYLKEDKAIVYNGETGAILDLPFKVTQPTLLFPFDLAQVVNASKEDSTIKLGFDYTKNICEVATENNKITIKLIDPATFREPTLEKELAPFEIEQLYAKVKRASFCSHIDASLPLMQGINFTPTSVCATDQRALWREQSENSEAFLLPKLLKDHIERLGIEPTSLALSTSQIFIFYSDMVMFGSRLTEDENFPDVNKVMDTLIVPMEDAAVVKYDQEALVQKTGMLLALPQQTNAITIKCSGNMLSAQNDVTDSSATRGVISNEVNSTADFDNVVVNGQLFLNGLQRFTQFSVKADQRRILFWNDAQQYCLSRRNVG